MRSKTAIVFLSVLALLAACSKSAPPKAGPPTGSALVTDPAGDIRDALNALGKRPAKPLASADIVGIRIDGDGTKLLIRIAVADSPASHIPVDEKEGPDWIMQMWPGGTTSGAPAYFAAILRNGPPKVSGTQLLGWRLSVCPGTQVCTTQQLGAKVAIVGKEVRAEIPLSAVPKLGNPFSWVALSYWNDSLDPTHAWSDYVPDVARPAPASTSYPAANVRATFPPPSPKR